MNVLVTGSNGFIGTYLCDMLERVNHSVTRLTRAPSKKNINYANKTEIIYDITTTRNSDLRNLLRNTECIIHLAARAHIIKETARDPLAAFRVINTLGTEFLARAAADSGVKRFVYISTIGVNGNMNFTAPFTERDTPLPHNYYSVSKWEAEQILHSISKETGLEIVIVRPPLVYGPGVKANFLRLLQIVDQGIPLPLASLHNVRSFLNIDNLVSFLILCLKHKAAKGNTFLVSDGEDLSTPQLIRKVALFMNHPCRLFSFPPNLLRFVGKLVGKEAMMEQLCGTLQVDISKARNILGWQPPIKVDEGLKKTVDWYLRNKAPYNNQ